MRRLFLAASVIASALLVSPSAATTFEADVAIYGATPAGVAAAIQTTRMGKKAVLISPQRRLGGMTTNGLGATDSGNKAVIGGIAREFYRRVKKHYDTPAARTLSKRDRFEGCRLAVDALWTFEPHVAEQIIESWLRAANVQIVRGERLIRSQEGVESQGSRLVSIRTEPSGHVYRAKMFIDASYEGDLLAAAGVSFTVGREANEQYGETCNGVQKRKNVKNHRFVVPVDPFITPGQPKSGLASGIHGDPQGEEGQADRRIQAYCFRMCMTKTPANRAPFPKPAGYDPSRYELLFRNFEAGDLRVPFHAVMMPNGKTDTNNNGAFSTDDIGMNYNYPEASYQRREEIIREHVEYQQGLMWTLANHARVPAKVREEVAQWGLAKDEFTDYAHWPTELYIREARRMVGDYVVTEKEARLERRCDDPIGMGSYNMDSHNCQRYVDESGHAANEGDVQVPPAGPYAISYRAIVPKRTETQNLLVPVCLSASHIAYGSIRMEPVFFILGQSAASAACQAIDAGCAVQDVAYAKLKQRLLADRQVLSYGKK